MYSYGATGAWASQTGVNYAALHSKKIKANVDSIFGIVRVSSMSCCSLGMNYVYCLGCIYNAEYTTHSICRCIE